MASSEDSFFSNTCSRYLLTAKLIVQISLLGCSMCTMGLWDDKTIDSGAYVREAFGSAPMRFPRGTVGEAIRAKRAATTDEKLSQAKEGIEDTKNNLSAVGQLLMMSKERSGPVMKRPARARSQDS